MKKKKLKKKPSLGKIKIASLENSNTIFGGNLVNNTIPVPIVTRKCETGKLLCDIWNSTITEPIEE